MGPFADRFESSPLTFYPVWSGPALETLPDCQTAGPYWMIQAGGNVRKSNIRLNQAFCDERRPCPPECSGWGMQPCLLESDGRTVLIDPFLTGNPKAAVKADDVPPT